jgi:serine/threonine protein kinase
MHALHIIHRDLKLSNVLLDAHGHPRTGPLGWGKVALDDKLSGIRVTEASLAPESDDRSTPSPMAVDVYSYAILLWELVTRTEYKFNGDRDVRPSTTPVARRKADMHIDAGFLANCWHGDPKQRPTFDDIVQYLQEAARPFRPLTQKPSTPTRDHSTGTHLRQIRICGFCCSRQQRLPRQHSEGSQHC